MVVPKKDIVASLFPSNRAVRETNGSYLLLRTKVEMRVTASEKDLVGQKLSNFYVEKLEYPSGSQVLSELPIRIWVMTPNEEDTVEISVCPAGCSIRIEKGKPDPVDMEEFGRTLILPQIQDEYLRALSVMLARIEPYGYGEKLTLQLSDGSELLFFCHGDDELRPSIDQSEIRK